MKRPPTDLLAYLDRCRALADEQTGIPKELMREAMQRIAKRRPGKRRLVYDREVRAIVAVDRAGRKTPTCLKMTEDG